MSPKFKDSDKSASNNTKKHSGINRGDSTLKDRITYGLTTQVALSRLHDEIENVLLQYERKFSEESCYQKLRSAFVKRYESPLGWYAIAASLMTTMALLIADIYFAALCLAAILSLDLYVVIRENNLRRTEIYRKTRHILKELKIAKEDLCADWQHQNYAHLCCPISPCVSLQWAYRDGNIVNLPWALLVRGDHIVVRPGHVTPGPCTEVNGKKSFNGNDIYGVAQIADPPLKPVARVPLPDLICCLQNTPYLDNLSIILENSLKRPPTIYNQQRYLLVTKYIQQWGFICTIIITIFAGLLRIYGVNVPSGSDNSEKHHWKHILIESSTAAVIPLLPLIFPLMWVSMNLWGIARLQSFVKTPQAVIAKDSEKSFEEDLDTPTYDYNNISLARSNVLRTWLKLWNGDSELLPRSANVVQVLGSITALCCVDKKGILSWPNPTAEKVFFLHDIDEDHLDEHSNSEITCNTDSDLRSNEENKEGGIVAEVLDLTHDQHCPFRLEFDDHEWKAHIKSLKPLGLAILLNTCSPQTHTHYSQFCGHVTAVSMLDKDLVPVTNRYALAESSMTSFLHGRCLCELAKQIGFTDHATDRFALESQLATYRHLQPDVVRRDIRFARHLQLSSKVKVPFPHALSVVMREHPGGYLSLFTQGTADIILDCCDDFWDGKDLRPLSAHDRKRALDFYQRNALTAYCTSFAYRPLRYGINGALSGAQDPIAYLELPPESKIRMQHVSKAHCDFESGRGKLSHSISTDSLLYSESKDDEVNDVDSCFEMQSHQVFIGMVTMQYQAQTDIVQLVEHLERACIRFVHFSKENELRSRVFSEKMGLESGWNCHISLLSEADDKTSTNVGPVMAATTQSPKHSGKNEFPMNSINMITASTHANTNLTNRPPLVHSVEISHISTSTTNTINVSTNPSHVLSIAPNVTGGSSGGDESELNCLLPPANLESSKTLSSSAPGAISDHGDYAMLNISGDGSDRMRINEATSDASVAGSRDSLHLIGGGDMVHCNDSAMDDHCHSLSILSESTEESAPVHFDLSNRAKLPRGIENIRPHLEQVDNVPLQVSLFTDCSAEATRQMLDIMQSYGEIVVCLGSSASNANANIFLQADCSIAVEPLYPQVCQDIPAYTEANILNNKLRLRKRQTTLDGSNDQSKEKTDECAAEELLESGLYGGGGSGTEAVGPMQTPGNTISPIYLSRLLNSLPCSIATCRDDPLSLLGIIELSRRFSSGLWNCIQYWACCAGCLSLINMLSACLSLPPILTPLMVIYLMCVPVPLIALSLAHIDVDPKIMNRATGKKQTVYDTKVFGFVIWCYGLKFVAPTLIVILCYCAFMAHPIEIMDVNEDNLHINLRIARIFSFLSILLHFIVISSSFVHRDHSMWQKNPFRNRIWAFTCLSLFLGQCTICAAHLLIDSDLHKDIDEMWPGIVFLFCGSVISLLVTEIAKWQEIKFNTRYQRRARLDFGTKLGMNSPF